MLRERGLAGEQMNSSDVDPPKPVPKTVSVMYGGDTETQPVSPKETHGWGETLLPLCIVCLM